MVGGVNLGHGLLSFVRSTQNDVCTVIIGFLWVFALVGMVSYVRGHHLTLGFRIMDFQCNIQFTAWERGV